VGQKQAMFHPVGRAVVAIFDALSAIQVNGVPGQNVFVARQGIAFVKSRFEPTGLIGQRSITAAAGIDPIVLRPAKESVGEGMRSTDKIKRVIVSIHKVAAVVRELDERAVVRGETCARVLAASGGPLQEKAPKLKG